MKKRIIRGLSVLFVMAICLGMNRPVEASEQTKTLKTAEAVSQKVAAEGADIVVTMDGERETDVLYGVNEDGSMYVLEEDQPAALPMDSDEKLMGKAIGANAAGVTDTSIKVVNFCANADGETISSSSTTTYTEYSTGESGYTCGAYGADAAYLGTTKSGKVKFMLGGVVGLVEKSKVQVAKVKNAKSVSCYYGDETFLMHRITTNMTQTGWSSSYNVGPRPSYITEGETYYSYDGHYFYKDYAQMLADYKADTRENSVNPQKPYYNYFQYLPLRSATNYTGAKLSSLINQRVGNTSRMYNTGNYFVNRQNTYGVNALLMVGLAANESGWGTSYLATERNNLFGINATDSNPNGAYAFDSVSECIKEFANYYMSQGYLNTSDWRYHGGFLGDKASGCNVMYASDPYWGEKAASHAWLLDRSGKYKDKNKYTLGIKDTIATSHSNVNVRKTASTSSKVLYTTGGSSNYSVIILGSSGNFYMIQSDSVLNASRSKVLTTKGNYKFKAMYAYISKDYVTKITNGSYTLVLKDDSICYSTYVKDYKWLAEESDGDTGGTIGENLRMEGLKVRVANPTVAGSVKYRVYTSTYGWSDWAEDGKAAGKPGEGDRIESLQIKLTGELAAKYDIYYRVRCQTLGWLHWAKNGQVAGTKFGNKRLEAIQIKLVAKGKKAPGYVTAHYIPLLIQYKAHIKESGWQNCKRLGQTAGIAGKGQQMEALKISLIHQKYTGSVKYRARVQSVGWQSWVKDGAICGTLDENKRMEAIQMKLTGKMAEKYDIYYRVYVEGYGWLDWAANGQSAGTRGMEKPLEAIQIRLVKKGGSAPGKTERTFYRK